MFPNRLGLCVSELCSNYGSRVDARQCVQTRRMGHRTLCLLHTAMRLCIQCVGACDMLLPVLTCGPFIAVCAAGQWEVEGEFVWCWQPTARLELATSQMSVIPSKCERASDVDSIAHGHWTWTLHACQAASRAAAAHGMLRPDHLFLGMTVLAADPEFCMRPCTVGWASGVCHWLLGYRWLLFMLQQCSMHVW